MQQYRLTRAIGRGGMGRVYLGSKLSPLNMDENRPVAVKLVPPRDLEAEERDAAALFQREATIAWRITHEHPNLVTTYDYGISVDGYRYLVLEFVDGDTLRTLTKHQAPLAYSIVRRIARDILSALAHLHKREVVHRDVADRNILIARNGEIKLSDFGLIKGVYCSVSDVFHGDVTHAAPEALQRRQLGPMADLYSLGVVLYRLLAGALPYGKQPMDIVQAMVEGKQPSPLPSETPADIAKLVRGLIALKATQRRWSTALDALAFIDGQAQDIASDDEVAAMVAERAPRVADDTDDSRDVPILGWPFADLAAPAPESEMAPAPTSPPEPSAPRPAAPTPRWPWALLPLSLLAAASLVLLGWMARAHLDARPSSSTVSPPTRIQIEEATRPVRSIEQTAPRRIYQPTEVEAEPSNAPPPRSHKRVKSVPARQPDRRLRARSSKARTKSPKQPQKPAKHSNFTIIPVQPHL